MATDTAEWPSRADYDPDAAPMEPVTRSGLLHLTKELADSGVMEAPARIEELEKENKSLRSELAELRALVGQNVAVMKSLQTSVNLHLPESFAAKLTSDIKVEPRFESPPQATVDTEPIGKSIAELKDVVRLLPGPADLTPVLTKIDQHLDLVQKVLDRPERPERPERPIINDNAAVAKALSDLGTLMTQQMQEQAKLVRKTLERLEAHVNQQEIVQKSLVSKLTEAPSEPPAPVKKNKKLTQDYDGSWLIEEVDAT